MSSPAPPPPLYHSKIDAKNVNRALKSLLKWRDSKSNPQNSSEPLDNNNNSDGGFVYLVVTLKKPPQIDRTNPITIPLPHPLIDLIDSPPDLCLIIDDKHKTKITKETALKKIEADNVPITTVIKVSKLKAELKKLEAEEGRRHELFFSERRLLPMLPKLLGKEFVRRKKSPIAISLRSGNWKEQVERVCESALVYVGTGTCSVVKVAKLSMGRKEIAENVVAVMEGIAGSIPGKWRPTMAGKQIGGEGGVPENLAGMTKSQLYDIMSQMKTLIDQNHEQAREILIRNPLLTKALFQAQIMLGMVQPPQVPKVDPLVAVQPQQSRQSIPTKPNVQAPVSSVQGGEPGATMQPQAPIRKHPMQQQQPLHMPPPPSVSATSNAPSQPRFSHPQRQGHLNPAATSLSHPQVQNAPPLAPHHPTSQQPQFHHLDIPASSTQLQQQQQPMHSVKSSHLAQQQARPYHHQFGPSQTGPNAGFQHHGAPPQHHSQPMFHSGNRPPASGGPQFPQGQPHLPSQPPYQGGGQFRGDYNNNQLGGPMAAERGPWMASQPESSNITHLPGLGPAPPPSQVGPGGGPPPRPAPISADMEKALLQQVMSLTPEQINLLPPEQRNQVLQLQQILRQ